MTTRDDWLQIVEMRDDGSLPIPCRAVVSDGSWIEHGKALEDVVLRYPEVFGEYTPRVDWDKSETGQRVPEPYTDRWGCRWDHALPGIIGQVVGHPLEDWDALRDYQAPDPMLDDSGRPIDWDEVRRGLQQMRAHGKVATHGFDHGFLFMRLYYLRGFENLMIDVALRDERVEALIEMIVEFYERRLLRVLPMEPDKIDFADDLGMQKRLTISPALWRHYIKPAYARLFSMCRAAGAHVYLHSDGYMVDIMGDLVEIGCTIENPQDLCNGLENIRRHLKGRVCIDLDIDRQKVVPFGTPAEIDRHIRTCVETLGSREGGLMMVWGIYPGTPLENIEATAAAMSRYRTMFCQGSGPRPGEK